MRIPREGTIRRRVYDAVANSPGGFFHIARQLPDITPDINLLELIDRMVSEGWLERQGEGFDYLKYKVRSST